SESPPTFPFCDLTGGPAKGSSSRGLTAARLAVDEGPPAIFSSTAPCAARKGSASDGNDTEPWTAGLNARRRRAVSAWEAAYSARVVQNVDATAKLCAVAASTPLAANRYASSALPAKRLTVS